GYTSISYNVGANSRRGTRKSKQKDTQETQPNDPTNESLNEDDVPAKSNDPPLSRVNTLGSGEDKLKLNELMELCTKLSERVLTLETTKTNQAMEIDNLKRRVKRLEEKRRSRNHGLKRLYKGRNIADIDADAETTLVNETIEDQGRYNDEEMFDTGVLELTVDDITLDKALKAFKTSKPKIKGIVVRDHKEPSVTTTKPTSIVDTTRPKAKGIVMQEPSEATTTTILKPSQVKNKGKGKIVEPEMPLKKKTQISLDEELAFKLQAKQKEEEERIIREKAQ
nr:hypothetical protein [Tanacetum cinerariifolium]